MSILDKEWENTQERAFTRWINSHLKKRDMEVQDLSKDLQDGVKLINLYEVISEESLGKYYPEPKLKFHQIANLNIVVREINEFVSSAGIRVQFSVEQIYEGDKRQILGMIWCLIHKFEIQDISEDELNAKEGLLLWVKKKIADFEDIRVDNFHNSWVDGLVFCALIHHHRPDLIDFASLSKENKDENLSLAFEVAERELDIPQLLEPSDLTKVARPDEKVLMTYVAYYWKTFASSKRSGKAANIISKNIGRQKELEQIQSEYEQRAQALLAWLSQNQELLQDTSPEQFGNSLESTSECNKNLESFKNNERSQKLAEKLELEILLANLHSQQKNAGLPVYTPPEELSVEVINDGWNELNVKQEDYQKILNERVSVMKRLEIQLNRFRSRSEKIQQWQEAKSEILSSNDIAQYSTVAALQNRIKQVESFADELETVRDNIEQTKLIGQDLVEMQHVSAEEVSSIIANLDELHNKINEQSTTLKGTLGEALKKLEDFISLGFEYSRIAEQVNLAFEDAALALIEPVQASSVTDVDTYDAALEKVAADINSQESRLEQLSSLSQQIEEGNSSVSEYSSHSLDSLQEKYALTKESIESRRGDLTEERTRQENNAHLQQQYGEECFAYSNWIDEQKDVVSANQEGDLDEQLDILQKIQEDVTTSSAERLAGLEHMYQQLEEADIAEQAEMSLQALYTLDDQLKNLTKKRIEAIEQQVQAEKAANVSDEQVEEFRKTFDHFDKDKSGTLNKIEFKACLASLDEDVSDEEVEKTFGVLDTSGDGLISFDEFLPWVSAIKREGTGFDDVLKAFGVLSGGSDYITEAQLRAGGLPSEEVEYLLEVMPQTEDGNFDYRSYLASQYGQN